MLPQRFITICQRCLRVLLSAGNPFEAEHIGSEVEL